MLRLTLCLVLALFGAALPARSQQAAPATDALLEATLAPWTGDLAGLAERGFLRVAVPNNPLFVAYDGQTQIGLAVERGEELKKHLKARHKITIDVILITLPRDRMIDALLEGQVDLIDANLTVTEARAERIAFTEPLRQDVREIVVSGPDVAIETFDDLADIGLHLRRSSSYHAHVEALNRERDRPIPVIPVDENLEDRDLLEMVHTGLVPAIVVDDHKANLWAQAFDGLALHEDLAVNEGGRIAWALRKDAPELKEALDGFVKTIKKGSLLGNILDKRYLQSASWIDTLDAGETKSRYQKVQPIILTHSEDYEIDWHMIIAQAYQESRLDQAARSKAGAVGIMQLLPSTAKDPNVGIADIHEVDANVEAGVKYLRFIKDRYFSSPEIDEVDRIFFSLAAYNAGPANISKARARAEKMGLDPDRWFDNVEIAAAKVISREPVIYVRNILKFAVYFRLRQDALSEADAAAAEPSDAEAQAAD